MGYVGTHWVDAFECWLLLLSWTQECESICAVGTWESPKFAAAFPPWPDLLINFGRVFWLYSMKKGAWRLRFEHLTSIKYF